MQANLPLLEKKAIKHALSEEWEEAIKVNNEIIEAHPENIKAKIRLGNAYLQIKDFSKAQKLFKQVLDVDPINTVAKKNYELAKNKKTMHSPSNGNSKALIKEPGTTVTTNIIIDSKGTTAQSFSYGASFSLKVKKHSVDIVADDKTIGTIEDNTIVKKLNVAKEKNADISASFIKGEGKEMNVLIYTSEPVFKGEKQDIKPYMKKGSIEEPELHVENFDDE